MFYYKEDLLMARKLREDITKDGLVKRLEGKADARKIRDDITNKGLVKRLTKRKGE